MRIRAILLSVLVTISFANAIGFDMNMKKHRKENVWQSVVPPRPTSVCPVNRLQPDHTLPIKRTIKPKEMFQVSRLRPDQSFITNGWASITPRDKCTVFVFELDAKEGFGKICNLVFDLPTLRDAPGLFRIIGPGQFSYTYFSPIDPPPTANVTWRTLPPHSPEPLLVTKEMSPGFIYILESTPCYVPLGTTGKITRSGMLCSSQTNFQFKPSDLRCPLGLYTIITDPFKNQ